MKYDFNALERAAHRAVEEHDIKLALSIYYMMADGDPSLDAGYLGNKIGSCYEVLGFMQAAKYWYGRAVEENPTIEIYKNNLSRLSGQNIAQMIYGEKMYDK